MSPSATATSEHTQYGQSNGVTSARGYKQTEFLFDRHLHKTFPVVTRAEGSWIHLADGREVFDATAGAAVACLGYNNRRVNDAMKAQIETGICYLASSFWSNNIVDQLCEELIDGTGGLMGRVYLTGSGTSIQASQINHG